MEDHGLFTAVKAICAKDARYPPGAYFFVVQALDFTVRSLNRATREGKERHVSGQELVKGIRDFALHQFGPMALSVLRSWNLSRTEDFGEIVYNLIGAEKLRKTDTDSKDDFGGGYDFEEAFAKPFLPEGITSAAQGEPRQRRRRHSPAKPAPRPGE